MDSRESRGGISRRSFLASVAAAGLATLMPGRTAPAVFAEPAEVDVDPIPWPTHVEDFPILASDQVGNVFLATLERPVPGPVICVYRLEGLLRQPPWTLQPENATGIGPPAMAALDNGCVVVFPVEQQGCWRLAYVFLDDETEACACSYIDSGGTDISPAVAVVGSDACVVWESNAGNSRGIHACWIDRDGSGEIELLSPADANSYNPALAALGDGSLFAAWDTIRDGAADIYGARLSDGSWQGEQRLTSDPRIERHPSLAVWENQVWMAWQAHDFNRVNATKRQCVAVAKIDDGGLLAPKGLFEQVSTSERQLVRPRIAFDVSGRLWLTARQSVGFQGGWQPVVWCYAGDQWSEQQTLVEQQGRWRPASACCTPADTIAACQCDDLPEGWVQQGEYPDWKSAVVLRVPSEAQGASFLETEPLEMPATTFNLAEKMELSGAKLPRQHWNHNGQGLTLFWGDLHEHTDLSVCDRRENPPGHDLFANARDIDRLDFCALTDHGYNFDLPQWAYNGEQTRYNHDPGRFVSFLGQEWTSSVNPPAVPDGPSRYGHRNLIFLDPYYDQFYDAYDGDVSPADLWAQLEGTDFICIPHQLADWKHEGRTNPPTDWSFVDEERQPVAEIWQVRGSYEYLGCPRQAADSAPFSGHYLQDAWAKGIIIGVIASPDHGGTSGKAGVWAEELTRESIFEAIRGRHTFGTSGPKMALWFSAGTAMMGDKVVYLGGEISFHVKAVALRNVEELVILRNNEVVHLVEPGCKEFDLHWTDENPPQEDLLWYYTRIRAEDDELAWSSPIWFVRPAFSVFLPRIQR